MEGQCCDGTVEDRSSVDIARGVEVIQTLVRRRISARRSKSRTNTDASKAQLYVSLKRVE